MCFFLFFFFSYAGINSVSYWIVRIVEFFLVRMTSLCKEGVIVDGWKWLLSTIALCLRKEDEFYFRL